MIILTSISSRVRSDKGETDWSLDFSQLTEILSIATVIGILVLFMSGCDTSFALGMTISIVISIAVSEFCKHHARMFLHGFKSKNLEEIALIASSDFVRSFVLMGSSLVIFNTVAPLNNWDA